jgi:hypothetical protein
MLSAEGACFLSYEWASDAGEPPFRFERDMGRIAEKLLLICVGYFQSEPVS